MLKRLIRHIRRKPKAVRDQYAFWIAASFTGVVVLVWLFSLGGRLSSVEPKPAETVGEVPAERESLSDMMDGLREEVDKLSQPATIPTTTPRMPATTTASTTSPGVNQDVAPAVRIATFTASTTP